MKDAKFYLILIGKANTLPDIVDINNIDFSYKTVAKLIHPDMCSLPGATDAFQKLSVLKDDYIKGTLYNDDAGEVRTNGYWVKFSGDKKLLQRSSKWLKHLLTLTKNKDLFHKYLPESFLEDNKGNTVMNLRRRSVPLTSIRGKLEQVHVNWILGRMLEFNTWLRDNGLVHCGYNPESIFITPEDHGIQIVSFYHMTKHEGRMKTISGAFKQWYPPEIFKTKQAIYDIDIELAKKVAIYLLGDTSGAGIKFRKTHNKDFIDFVVKRDEDPVQAFLSYRNLIKKNFKKKFYELNL